MNKKKRKIKYELVILFAIILLISFIIYKISPGKIVDLLGIENSYFLIFIFGFLGGVSILFPFPYYIFVFAMGSSGLNPIIIGICAGFGVFLGESTSYFLGYSGREILPDKIHKYASKFENWCFRHPPWLIPIILFFYGALVPLPNDIITLTFGIARYPFIRTMIPLGLGNIVFNIILAFLGLYGFSLIL